MMKVWLQAGVVNNRTVAELLEIMAVQYGYDFRDYAKDSTQRRIALHMERHDFTTLDALKVTITDDAMTFADLLRSLWCPLPRCFETQSFSATCVNRCCT